MIKGIFYKPFPIRVALTDTYLVVSLRVPLATEAHSVEQVRASNCICAW